MANVHEITVWTRGVVKDKEGRDVANGIARAADREGRFTQAFDNYVDLPDRVNVPLRKYARISDEEIEERYDYENLHPEIVIVADATIVPRRLRRGEPWPKDIQIIEVRSLRQALEQALLGEAETEKGQSA